jgi:acyl carrier protein
LKGVSTMLNKVIEILSDFTDIDKSQIRENSELTTDLGLNSLDVVNLVVTFEDEFNIEIPDTKIKNLTTVADIVNYIKEYNQG